MWMLDFLPNWLFHLMVIIGALGVVVGQFFVFIPVIRQYLLPIRVVSIIILAIGVYFEGGISNEDKWIARVHDLELKVKDAEVKSANANTQIVTKYVDKVKVIKETQDARVEYIDRFITKESDAKCDVPNAFVVLHDSASKNELPPGPGPSYEGTSGIKISEVGRVVTDNYTTCYEIREQVKSWQDWYKTQRSIFDQVNK